MAELVYAWDLKSQAFGIEGSSPSVPTKVKGIIMTKFVSFIVGDIEWFGVRLNDTLIPLYPSCKVGSCRRPGTRMK